MALVAATAADGGGAPLAAPDVIASVPAAPGSRLFFTWGAGTQIQLCEVQGPTQGSSPCASTVAWSAPGMEQRRIAYDVLPLYRQLRQALQQDDPAPGARFALLRSYARSVRLILMSGGSDPEASGYILYEAAAWHLLELFFLEPETSEGYFSELFANWLALHGALLAGPSGHSLAERVEELTAASRIEADPAYWPVVRRLLAVGQLEAAGQLLLAHPAYSDGGDGTQRDLIDRVYHLIRTAPRLRGPGAGAPDLGLLGAPTEDPLAFRSARGAWARRARQLAGEGGGVWEDAAAEDPAAARGLRSLLSIMLGDERSLRDACASWPELLSALLFWRFADASPQLHLAQLVGSCVEQMAAAAAAAGRGELDDGFLEFLRELLPLASQLEVQGVVRLCTNSDYCGLWFVAHAYDVLRGYPRAEALFSRTLPHLGCDQVEMYTLHYVQTLMGCDGTWQVAAEYLAWCPMHGADAMESLLSRLPLPPDDGAAALKALALCRRHGLSAAARSLCARMSARAGDAGLPGAALQWALRGGDQERCARLVAPVLERLQAQLEQRSGSLLAAPLDLPELDELAPLLDCLPLLAGWDGDDDDGSYGGGGGLGGGSGGRAGDANPHWQQQLRKQQQGRRRRQQPYGTARVAHPELQLLRSFHRLQVALRALQYEHARQAASRDQQEQQQQQAAGLAPGGGGSGGGSASGSAALRAAYEAARRPLMDILGLPLAPPPLRLPLLHLAVPLLETQHMAFRSGDVRRLLQLLGATLAAHAAAGCEGVPADGAAAAGGAGGAGAGAGGAGAVRLALSRALARAHIVETSESEA